MTHGTRDESEPAPPLSAGRTFRLATAGLSLIAACYGLARFAYGLFVPAFRNAFDLDAATAGSIASASYVSYCVAILAATALTPRLGARTVSIAAGCLATLGTALIAIAPGTGMLAVGVAIAGSSTGVASPPLAHAIAAHVTAARRDRVQTVVNAGTGVGVMVSGPIALLAQDQWRTAWLAFAVAAAVVTVCVARAVPGPDARAAPRPPRARTGTPPLLPHGVARLLAAAIVTGAASSVTWTFGQDLLVTDGGHGHLLSTVAWIALGACGLVGSVAGDLAERMGLRTAWMSTMLAMGAATACLAAGADRAIVAVGASALFGAAYITLTGLLLVWSTRLYPDRPSLGVGLAFLLIALGQAIAAPLIGALADRMGLPAGFWAAALLAVAGCLVAPRRRRARDPAERSASGRTSG